MASRAKEDIFIYSLTDPTDGIIRYVGKTNDLSKRYSSHIRCHTNTHTRNWIYSLRILGVKPILEVIDMATESDWMEKEKGYIKLIKSCGAKLTNQTQGGDSGIIFTEEVRLKMRNAQLGKIMPEETREKLRGKRGKQMNPSTLPKPRIPKTDEFKRRATIFNIKNPPIHQYDLDGTLIRKWISAADAQRKAEFSESCILRCCSGERKKHKGFIWKFEKQDTDAISQSK